MTRDSESDSATQLPLAWYQPSTQPVAVTESLAPRSRRSPTAGPGAASLRLGASGPAASQSRRGSSALHCAAARAGRRSPDPPTVRVTDFNLNLKSLSSWHRAVVPSDSESDGRPGGPGARTASLRLGASQSLLHHY